MILGRSDNTPQPVPIIKGVVRAPPPEPLVGRSTKRARGTVQPSTTKSRTKTAIRHLKSRTRHVDDGVEADEEDEDHSSDPELLRQQGYTQGTDQQFECIDQATGTVIVRGTLIPHWIWQTASVVFHCGLNTMSVFQRLQSPRTLCSFRMFPVDNTSIIADLRMTTRSAQAL